MVCLDCQIPAPERALRKLKGVALLRFDRIIEIVKVGVLIVIAYSLLQIGHGLMNIKADVRVSDPFTTFMGIQSSLDSIANSIDGK